MRRIKMCIRDRFKRSGKKPSEFCKTNLRMHDVKSYDFVKQYFSTPPLLVKAIKEYRRTANILSLIHILHFCCAKVCGLLNDFLVIFSG